MAGRPERYRFSRRAEADLEAIYDYAVERWSKSQADRYYGDLMIAFADLVSEDGIDVLRTLHQAMDAERRLKP